MAKFGKLLKNVFKMGTWIFMEIPPGFTGNLSLKISILKNGRPNPKKQRPLELPLPVLNGLKWIFQKGLKKEILGPSKIWLRFQIILNLEIIFYLLDGILWEHPKSGVHALISKLSRIFLSVQTLPIPYCWIEHIWIFLMNL